MSGGGGGGGGNNHLLLSNINKCGLTEILLFTAAVLFGTCTSICSKTMMSMTGTTTTTTSIETEERFQKPLFQTFGMFVGMIFGLVMHVLCVYFTIPFPGYDHGLSSSTAAAGVTPCPTSETTSLLTSSSGSGRVVVAAVAAVEKKETKVGIPTSMYFLLAIPAAFDLGATALCMMGLQYLNVSIYQMLRGSGIVFVALMKQYVLKEELMKFHWVGVFWNVVSVVIVGGTAMLAAATTTATTTAGGGEQLQQEEEGNVVGNNGGVTTAEETMFGVGLLIAGAFVQSCQFVLEEKVMKLDIPVPPLLLIGMEGFWGVVLSIFVMYPLAYLLPGDDHGSYEDPFNTWAMFIHSKNIQVAFMIYFFTIFMYNVFAVLVTFQLSSIWHAILDNFRPITVWATDLFIFYYISPLFGEVWTKYSSLQVVGMVVLVYGTAIYNAPNDGSLLLEGQWWAFGINLSEEYNAIRKEQEEAAIDAEWDRKKIEFKKERLSSFMTSPRVGIHTPIGAGAAKM